MKNLKNSIREKRLAQDTVQSISNLIFEFMDDRPSTKLPKHRVVFSPYWTKYSSGIRGEKGRIELEDGKRFDIRISIDNLGVSVYLQPVYCLIDNKILSQFQEFIENAFLEFVLKKDKKIVDRKGISQECAIDRMIAAC